MQGSVGRRTRGRPTGRLLATVVAALLVLGVGAGQAAEASAKAGTAPGATAPPAPVPAPVAGALGRALGDRALVPIPSPGCLIGSPAMMTGKLRSGRTYRMHLPDDYDPRHPYPVLLAYHGRSQQARDIQRYSGLDRADAVVLYPQGRTIRGPKGSTAWEGTRDLPVDGKDVAFTKELLAAAGRSLCIDSARVTAVGASQGGGFANVLACTAPGTVSAIAAVAGAFYRPEDGGVRNCRSGPMRVLEFHGTADPVIDYDGTKRSLPIPDWLHAWAKRNDCVGGPETVSVPPDVTERSWTDCAGRSEVQHFRVTAGNHGWPGAAAAAVAGGGVRTDTVSATTLILRFAAGMPLDPSSTGKPHPAPSSRSALRLPLLGDPTVRTDSSSSASRVDRRPAPAAAALPPRAPRTPPVGVLPPAPARAALRLGPQVTS